MFNWENLQEAPQNDSFSWESLEEVQSEESASEFAERMGLNALIGSANLGHALLNLPYNLTGLVSEEAAQGVPHLPPVDYAFALGQKSNEPSDVLMQKLVEYLPSFMLPGASLGAAGRGISQIPKAGKYIEAGLSQAIPQTAYTYGVELQDNPEQAEEAALLTAGLTAPFGALGKAAEIGSPAMKKAASAGAALGGAGLGYAGAEAIGLPEYAQIPASILSGYLTERGISPKSYASKKVLEEVNPEQARNVVEAAERLGLSYVTPAEATGTQFAGERQASLGRTPAGSKLMYEKGVERLASEERAISNFLNDLFSGKELSAEKSALYDKVMGNKVPMDLAKDMATGDDIIGLAVKNVERNPVYKQALKDTPKDSFKYWDQIKKVLDDMEQSARRGANPKNYEASLISKSRSNLVGAMDAIDPDYAKARSIAQREITRRDLEKSFDKKELTGRNFYKTIASKEKYNKLSNSLSAFPELQRQLEDMRTVFPRLLDVPTARTAAAKESTSMNKPRAFVQSFEDLIGKTIGSRADVEAVKLMTDPNWYKKLVQERQKKGNTEFLSMLAKEIGKITGQAPNIAREKKND